MIRWPSNFTPKYIHMWNENICPHTQKIYTGMFILALCTIPKQWKQPRCPKAATHKKTYCKIPFICNIHNRRICRNKSWIVVLGLGTGVVGEKGEWLLTDLECMGQWEWSTTDYSDGWTPLNILKTIELYTSNGWIISQSSCFQREDQHGNKLDSYMTCL